MLTAGSIIVFKTHLRPRRVVFCQRCKSRAKPLVHLGISFSTYLIDKLLQSAITVIDCRHCRGIPYGMHHYQLIDR